MINALNNEAFELKKLISRKPKEIPEEPSEFTGSTKERGIIDWSDKVVESLVARTTDHTGNTLEIFTHDENGSFGFYKNNYPRFQVLIQKLHSLEYFNKAVSIHFIESESFMWMIRVSELLSW